MANEQNLRPCEYKLTQEEQKRGGIASGKARREKKALKETLELLLQQAVKDSNGKAVKNPITNEPEDYQTRIVTKLVLKAGKGDIDAIRLVQSMKGEEKTNIKLDADVKADVDVSTLPDKILFDIADKLQGIEPD
jgi:hypothetical protein